MNSNFQGVSDVKMREDFHGMMPYAVSKIKREIETVHSNDWPLEMFDQAKLKERGGKSLLICYKCLGARLEIIQGSCL